MAIVTVQFEVADDIDNLDFPAETANDPDEVVRIMCETACSSFDDVEFLGVIDVPAGTGFLKDERP